VKAGTYDQIKARASIPVQKSAVLIGVADPTGTLKNHQIYIKLRRDNFVADVLMQDKNKSIEIETELQRCEIITGRVVVGRSPCTYPSEIRTLEAVDCP
jgi:RNA-dependent RNA polymerase